MTYISIYGLIRSHHLIWRQNIFLLFGFICDKCKFNQFVLQEYHIYIFTTNFGGLQILNVGNNFKKDGKHINDEISIFVRLLRFYIYNMLDQFILVKPDSMIVF